jgi:hypothetical protein
MSTPKTDLGIPLDGVIGTVGGQTVQVTYAWQQHWDGVAKAATKLREAAELMDTLATAPTTTEIATAWNEFRTKLQEIV